ncbi:MAG: uroporphyrinogen decarboxylase family protein [Fimbriimonadales bacterium]|nr:uroporphyrinogen decarboxylase family protein [Fimbriimonadales bacterium]
MNGLENFQAMMVGAQAERLPFDVSATPPFCDVAEREAGTRDVVEALGGDFRGLWIGSPVSGERWREAYREVLGLDLGPDHTVDSLGVAHAIPKRETLGSAYHLLEMAHPLAAAESVSQLERLPWPDFDDPALYADLEERVRAVHREGRGAIGGLACTVFESAWYLRGMDRFFEDLVDGNPISLWLMDWFEHRAVRMAREYARAGADVLQLGDDVGSQRGMLMSVPMWREHLKPRLARVIRSAKEANPCTRIFYHSDGDVRAIVPDLVEIGVEILNPVQPECMPIDELFSEYGDRLAFWGMIGTQTTMPFGTPPEVRAAVRHLRGWARRGVRIVVAPTHVLEPDVPWENAAALREAVYEPLGSFGNW